MNLPTQIQFIESLELSHIGETRKSLQEVKESLRQYHAILKKVAPKYESYQRFVGEYVGFMYRETGIQLVEFNAVQGKALKEIISKLLRLKEGATEADALLMWVAVLNNWKRLNAYMQQKKKLSDINSNLIEILDQIKNGNYQSKQSTTATNANNAQSLIEQRRQRRTSSGEAG